MTDRLMLLDTASLYFRAYYGVPDTVRAPDGTPVNAVRGLLDFIARLVSDHQPTNLVACWDDDWRPQFRVDAIASYKAHRVAVAGQSNSLNGEEVSDTLIAQVDLIIEVLALLGICRIGAPGYEADDVIGSLTERATTPVLVVTGDRDLFQLVSDSKQVTVLYTAAKGVGSAEVLDDEAILARYGIRADQYADFALLRGDTSDGLPGVRGIGEKTAAKLISEYGTVGNLMEAVMAGKARLTPSVATKLRDGADYVRVAGPVVAVARHIAFPALPDKLPAAPPDPEALAAFAQKWGLVSSVERVSTAFGWTLEA